MPITVAEVRQRAAAALETATGWTESGYIGGAQWVNTGAAESPQGGTFAVTMPSTGMYETTDSQVPTRPGAFVPNRPSEMRVDYVSTIPLGGAAAAYDASLDAETTLVAALFTIDASGGLRLYETGAVRQVVQDEDGAVVAIHGVLTFRVTHPFVRS